MNVILQQLRVVVGHLLEVRHYPALVNRVAMKAAGKLVVHAAFGHLGQCRDDHIAQSLIAGAGVLISEQIENAGMRKFGRGAKAAVLCVKHLHRGIDDVVRNLRRDLVRPPSE